MQPTKEEKLLAKIVGLSQWEYRIPVIGICGPGAAGKTKLAKALECIGWLDTVRLGTDAWFTQSTVVHSAFVKAARVLGDAKLIEYCENPFNRHGWDKFEKDFNTLLDSGHLQTNGLYHRKDPIQLSHSVDIRLPLQAPSIVVLEGMYLLDGAPRRKLDFVIGVTAPDDLLLERRLKREIGTKTEQQIVERHALEIKHVKPYHDRLMHTADVVLQGPDETERMYQLIAGLTDLKRPPKVRRDGTLRKELRT